MTGSSTSYTFFDDFTDKHFGDAGHGDDDVLRDGAARDGLHKLHNWVKRSILNARGIFSSSLGRIWRETITCDVTDGTLFV